MSHFIDFMCVCLHTDNAFETHLCSTKFIISNFNSQDFWSPYVWYKTIYETKLQYVLMLISNSVLSFYLKGIENALHFIIIDLKTLKKWNWSDIQWSKYKTYMNYLGSNIKFSVLWQW